MCFLELIRFILNYFKHKANKSSFVGYTLYFLIFFYRNPKLQLRV